MKRTLHDKVIKDHSYFIYIYLPPLPPTPPPLHPHPDNPFYTVSCITLHINNPYHVLSLAVES